MHVHSLLVARRLTPMEKSQTLESLKDLEPTRENTSILAHHDIGSMLTREYTCRGRVGYGRNHPGTVNFGSISSRGSNPSNILPYYGSKPIIICKKICVGHPFIIIFSS